MSLLSEAMERCIMLDKRTVADGYGGYITTYTDGAEFQAAIVLMSPVEVIAAQQGRAGGAYNVLTEKSLNLQYHDVIRRASDGKIFRITSDGDDDKTPNSAGLNIRKVSAEEWELPS